MTAAKWANAALEGGDVYAAKAEGRVPCARDYDMLRSKGNEVAEKLAMLKTRDDNSWHDLGTGVERTWRDMAEDGGWGLRLCRTGC